MSRADDIALWYEVNRTIIGLTGVVEMFAKRVRRADRLDLAREMIAHSASWQRGRNARPTASPSHG